MSEPSMSRASMSHRPGSCYTPKCLAEKLPHEKRYKGQRKANGVFGRWCNCTSLLLRRGKGVTPHLKPFMRSFWIHTVTNTQIRPLGSKVSYRRGGLESSETYQNGFLGALDCVRGGIFGPAGKLQRLNVSIPLQWRPQRLQTLHTLGLQAWEPIKGRRKIFRARRFPISSAGIAEAICFLARTRGAVWLAVNWIISVSSGYLFFF